MVSKRINNRLTIRGFLQGTSILKAAFSGHCFIGSVDHQNEDINYDRTERHSWVISFFTIPGMVL